MFAHSTHTLSLSLSISHSDCARVCRFATAPSMEEHVMNCAFFGPLSPFLHPRTLRWVREGDIVGDMLEVSKIIDITSYLSI